MLFALPELAARPNRPHSNCQELGLVAVDVAGQLGRVEPVPVGDQLGLLGVGGGAPGSPERLRQGFGGKGCITNSSLSKFALAHLVCMLV